MTSVTTTSNWRSASLAIVAAGMSGCTSTHVTLDTGITPRSTLSQVETATKDAIIEKIGDNGASLIKYIKSLGPTTGGKYKITVPGADPMDAAQDIPLRVIWNRTMSDWFWSEDCGEKGGDVSKPRGLPLTLTIERLENPNATIDGKAAKTLFDGPVCLTPKRVIIGEHAFTRDKPAAKPEGPK